MLDAHISIPKALGDALLDRLDRLLSILEYHFPPPRVDLWTERRPRPSQERRSFQVTDRSLWENETARARLELRGVEQPSQAVVEKEIMDMYKEAEIRGG